MLAKITTKNQLTLPKAVMQQVKSSLEQKIKQMQISLSGEPVLRLTGLSAATLPHMDYEVAGTSALPSRTWRMRSLGAGEKKRDAYSGCAGY